MVDRWYEVAEGVESWALEEIWLEELLNGAEAISLDEVLVAADTKIVELVRSVDKMVVSEDEVG